MGGNREKSNIAKILLINNNMNSIRTKSLHLTSNFSPPFSLDIKMDDNRKMKIIPGILRLYAQGHSFIW